jgi:hypothetical protein
VQAVNQLQPQEIDVLAIQHPILLKEFENKAKIHYLDLDLDLDLDPHKDKDKDKDKENYRFLMPLAYCFLVYSE